MTLSLIGSATSDAGGASARTSIAFSTYPTGAAQGDYLEVCVSTSNATVSTSISPPSTPAWSTAGWVLVDEQENASAPFVRGAFYRIYCDLGAPSGTSTFTHGSAQSTGVLCCVRGADTTTYLDRTPQAADLASWTGATTSAPVPQITTATDNALSVIGFGLTDSSSTTLTAPSGYTQIAHSTRPIVDLRYVLVTPAGTTPSGTINYIESASRNGWVGNHAVKPAGGGGTTGPPVSSLALLGVGA